MQVYIKETLYVLDYDNNIKDMIFASDDHRTPGYAYNINIDESNMGYSNLTFTMPTRILAMPNELNESPASEDLIPNPKLDLLTPLVKLRYNRQVIYTGTETIMVQTPQGYGDTTSYIDVEYKPGQVVEDYVMDYIVQPSDKKRSGYEVSVTFNAIDYPRFNLSKKKFGLTINENTVTRSEWSLFDTEPMSVAGTVKYIQWNDELSNVYGSSNFPIPTEWDPTTALTYPMNATQINNMMAAKEEWPYGLSATVYWWPIVNTGRFEGVMYEQGDFLTLHIYPKFKTGTDDTSAIETNLDFYGYEWLFLDKGQDFLTPNNPCNYLNWTLENTNWSVAVKNEKPAKLHTWLNHPDKLTSDALLNALPSPELFNYEEGLIMRLVAVHNANDPMFVGSYTDEKLPQLTENDLGKWAYVTKDDVYEDLEISTFAIYSWDGYKWYHNYNTKEYIDIHFYQMRDREWVNVDKEYWTSTIGKSTGVLYDVDIVETEVAKPDSSSGSLFETTDLRASLSLSDSNCYNAITEIAKTFQLYPVFDCKKRTVALKLFAGKNYGLTYMLGRSLENTAVKADGDKVITKLYSYGGQDAKGSENINLGDAERSYEQPTDNPDERVPWDPNASEYIQKRSPYGTNYIYNFKWMYDNQWMSKEQILGLYELNSQIQELNKKVLKPLTEDFVATTDAYVNAGVQLSTDQDEYLAIINSMMNTYYRRPGETTEKFTAFPVAPAGCYENPANSGIYYLNIYHCHECGATRGENTADGRCTTANCQGYFQEEVVHINTWGEEHNSAVGQGTTSSQWDPSSKGFFQEVYEQLGTGLREHIYLNKIFKETDIDDLSTEKKYIINGTTVYDKSSHLYHWNDCVNKWIKQYGLTIEDEKRVTELQHKVKLLEEAQKVYNHDLAKLEDEVQDKYGNFIIEGKFNDPEIVYSSVLLVKTLEASEQYATPEVTYSLNVIDSSGLIEYRKPGSEVYNELVHSLHSVGQIVPKAGDYVTIYDEPMGLYGVPGLITNIKRVLDNPQSNSITVDTSYTDDEELVGNIITATNTVLSNKDIYARTAILKSDGTISGAAMAKTLEESVGENISFIGVSGSTLLDSNGLLATNPNNPERKIKYTGAGVFGTVDNGITYDAMMTPEGINANYINSGSIDTRKLQIISGLYSKVVLDNFGLSVKADSSSRYILPDRTKIKTIEDTTFVDWTDSNLKAFIGVNSENEAQLYLNGQMQIDGGSIIAGWNVLKNKITSGLNNKYVGISSDGNYAFWAGNSTASNAPFWVKATGEAHFTNVLVDGNSTVQGNNIAASTITADKIVDKTLTAAKLADRTITGVKIGQNVIAGEHIIANTITGDKIAANTITASNIQSGSITADRIDATNLKIRAGNVTGQLTASQINVNDLFSQNITVNGTFKGATIEGGTINLRGSRGNSVLSIWDIDSNTGTYYKVRIDAYSIFMDSPANNQAVNIRTYENGVGAMTLTGNGGYTNIYGGQLYASQSIGAGNLSLSNNKLSSSSYVQITAGSPSKNPGTATGGIYLYSGRSVNLYGNGASNLDAAVYAGCGSENSGNNSPVTTKAGNLSSRSTKENIRAMTEEQYNDALLLLNHMQLYTYDYKYDLYPNPSQYGFILDEIQEEDKKHNFLHITDGKAWVKGRRIDMNMDNKIEDGEIIDIKDYDRDAFTKYLLTCIKALYNEIQELKKEKTY